MRNSKKGNINSGKGMKTRWDKWQNKRLLRNYYRKQNLATPQGPGFLQDCFIFMVAVLILLWYAPTLTIALWGTFVLFVIIGWRRYFKRQQEKIRLKKACFQKIAEREYQRRLEKMPHDLLLQMLQEEISKKFKISGWEIEHGLLVGRYLGKKVALVYLDANHEEFIATSEVVSIVKKCFQREILQVNIFTNGDYVQDLSNLGQAYGINLNLYNGETLRGLLKNTLLLPTVSEIKEVINYEKLQQPEKEVVIKKEILNKQRVTGYFFYSGLLFFMAWLGWGFVYLNVVAGLILLGFAVTIMVKT